MKNPILGLSVVLCLVSASPALADLQLTINGQKAADILNALRNASLSPAGGTEDSADYRASTVDCIKRFEEPTPTECVIDPGAPAAAIQVQGARADAILNALVAAGTVLEHQMQTEDVMIAGLAGNLGSGGPDAAQVSFVDTSATAPTPPLGEAELMNAFDQE